MNNELLEKRLGQGRIYRSMEMTAAEDEMTVEGYATTFNEPYVLYRDKGYVIKEQIDKNAFANTDMSDVIMQYDHEGRVFARLSNGTLALRADEHGLHVAAMLGGTDIGRQLYQEIKGGYTNKMSFGFRVDNDSREIIEDGEETVILRTILSVSKLFDVSAVSLPANDFTSISARSYGESVIADVVAECEKAEAVAAERRNKVSMIKLLTEI